jgi:pimeloyl-ACP methyl ester carboxylesterase
MSVETIEDPILTTAYHIKGPSPTCPLFILVPGNPGLAQFYSKYLDSLKAKLPKFELFALSLLGFSTTAVERKKYDPNLRVHTLQEQIDHIFELTKSLASNAENEPRDLYISGHSVGAWIAQRVAVRVKDIASVNLKFVGLLTPTLKDIALSERGVKFTLLVKYFPIDLLGARLLQALNWLVPVSGLQMVVRFIVGSDVENHAHGVACELATRPQFARQTIGMAIEEMKLIDSATYPPDIGDFWEQHQTYKIWAFFANKDHWIADSTRKELADEFETRGNVEFIHMDATSNISHNFCVTNSELVADYTVNAMESVDESIRSS